MSVLPDGICPLCSKVFPRERLQDHVAVEHPRLRQNTILVIQAYHPSWVLEHGACETCWKTYRDAGRILGMLREARSRNSAVPLNSSIQ